MQSLAARLCCSTLMCWPFKYFSILSFPLSNPNARERIFIFTKSLHSCSLTILLLICPQNLATSASPSFFINSAISPNRFTLTANRSSHIRKCVTLYSSFRYLTSSMNRCAELNLTLFQNMALEQNTQSYGHPREVNIDVSTPTSPPSQKTTLGLKYSLLRNFQSGIGMSSSSRTSSLCLLAFSAPSFLYTRPSMPSSFSAGKLPSRSNRSTRPASVSSPSPTTPTSNSFVRDSWSVEMWTPPIS